MFHVGQKVVCVETWIRSAPPWGYGDEVGPVAGKTYTLREIGKFNTFEDCLCVRLAEIRNPLRSYSMIDGEIKPWEAAFRASRFRSLIERKTSISIFTEILDRANKRMSEKVG